MQTLKPYLKAQQRLFAQVGVEAPALSAELLLAKALGTDRQCLLKLLITEPARALPPSALKKYSALAARRLSGEPVAYILGQKEFYGRDFKVNPAVLIPRPESELLIDAAKNFFAWQAAGRFADLGTGSGCIAVTLALELGGHWLGLALDNSPAALQTARLNAERLGAAGRLDFALGDFNDYALPPAGLDLVAANPPYVSEAEYAALDKGVRGFEPKSALVPAVPNAGAAPASGLEDLARIAALAAPALKSGGLLLMEMGCAQGPALLELLAGAGLWSERRIIKDLAGLDRLIFARRA